MSLLDRRSDLAIAEDHTSSSFAETLILDPTAKAGCGRSTNAKPDFLSISTTETFTLPLIDSPGAGCFGSITLRWSTSAVTSRLPSAWMKISLSVENMPRETLHATGWHSFVLFRHWRPLIITALASPPIVPAPAASVQTIRRLNLTFFDGDFRSSQRRSVATLSRSRAVVHCWAASLRAASGQKLDHHVLPLVRPQNLTCGSLLVGRNPKHPPLSVIQHDENPLTQRVITRCSEIFHQVPSTLEGKTTLTKRIRFLNSTNVFVVKEHRGPRLSGPMARLDQAALHPSCQR